MAWASDKADELANTGAIKDCAEMAELVAKDDLDARKKLCATKKSMRPPFMTRMVSWWMLKQNKNKPEGAVSRQTS